MKLRKAKKYVKRFHPSAKVRDDIWWKSCIATGDKVLGADDSIAGAWVEAYNNVKNKMDGRW